MQSRPNITTRLARDIRLRFLIEIVWCVVLSASSGLAQLSDGDETNASPSATQFRELEDDNIASDGWQVLNNRANELLREGELDRALEAYQAIPKNQQNELLLTFNEGVASFRGNDFDLAAEKFSLASRSSDDRVASNARYNLGNIEYLRALEILAAASDKNADPSQQAFDPATCVSNLESAIGNYRDALRVDPSLQDARANAELAARLLAEIRNQMTEQQNSDQDSPDQDSNDRSQSENTESGSDQEPAGQDTADQDTADQDTADQDTADQDTADQDTADQDTADQEPKDGESNTAEEQSVDENESGDGQKSGDNQETSQSQQDQSADRESMDQSQEERAGDASNSDDSQSESDEGAGQDANSEEPESDSSKSNAGGEPESSQPTQTPSNKQGKPPASESNSDGQPGDLQKDAPKFEGELSTQDDNPSENGQSENGQSENGGQIGTREVKNMAMTMEEAMKMLQAVRDRNMLRRLREEQMQRARARNVEKDW